MADGSTRRRSRRLVRRAHVETAVAESVFRRTQELREVHAFETRVQMRVYLADFRAFFHDIRESPKSWAVLYNPDSYTASQAFAQGLLESRSNGIVYRSVRHPGGECVACFRPALVQNVRVGGHYEFRWEGRPEPIIKRTQQTCYLELCILGTTVMSTTPSSRRRFPSSSKSRKAARTSTNWIRRRGCCGSIASSTARCTIQPTTASSRARSATTAIRSTRWC